MHPEDRVLVGVINTKRDLKFAQEAGWYRIPQKRMPRGVNADYLAFFLSGRVFKEQSGAIGYYAKINGMELARRRDLINKPDHPRADEVYYKVALDALREKTPPVRNSDRRPVVFIRTTWDRFVHAATIKDLYSTADYFVDRIYHALRNRGVEAQQLWEIDRKTSAFAPGLSILCEQGTVTASTEAQDGAVFMDISRADEEILQSIMDAIDRKGGYATINLPLE